MAVSFVTVLYWDQLQALFGMGSQTPRFEFRPKADPISAPYLLSFFSSIAIFIGIPYGEELWRCLKAGRRRELAVSTGRATS